MVTYLYTCNTCMYGALAMGVTGNTTLNSSLIQSVSGITKFSVNTLGNTTVGGALTMTGSRTLNGTLTAVGNITLNGNLTQSASGTTKFSALLQEIYVLLAI